jgi:hypothetical protein
MTEQVNVVSNVVPVYRYFTADLLTNTVLAEIPFVDVSYERAIKAAGAFSGRIAVIPKTESMDLYTNTMPGRTALYVVRDNVCVWGGVIWARSYNAVQRSMSVDASEFTSYFHHRNIWKTWSHNFTATITVAGGVGTAVLDGGATYTFDPGVPIRIDYYDTKDFTYNGYYTNTATTTSETGIKFNPNGQVAGTYSNCTITVRADTYDYIRQLLDSILVDYTGVDFANSDIEPGVPTYYTILSTQSNGTVGTVVVSGTHGLLPGQVVEIVNVDPTYNGYVTVQTTPTTSSFTFELIHAALPYTMRGVVAKTVTNKALTDYFATITTSTAHGFYVGETVVLAGIDDPNSPDVIFNGTFTIQSVPTSTTFTVYCVYNNIDSVAAVGTATMTPAAKVATYGPFYNNSDIGLDYSTNAYSGVNVINKTYRGFELRNAGEELDAYSDTLKGFEYRIDCAYDPTSSSFTREFVLLAIDFPNPPAPGQVSPISRFGADKYVFEYPGNILDFTIDESADKAATRFWVVGSLGGIGSDASEPYSAATSKDLLLQGWPLLDAEQTLSDSINDVNTLNNGIYIDVSSEQTLYDYAQRYLAECRPPMADFTISVNGSLDPQVGTYNPGDWVSVVSQDPFIQMRLSSDLEPRTTAIVRKIDKIKVTVPNFPSFPEKVSLDLIPEWLVDKLPGM